MKVLNIMTSNLDYNGIGMSLLNYYNNINSDIIQMDYLVPKCEDDILKKEFIKKGNKLFELNCHGKKMHQRRPLLYCYKLYKIIKNEKYDIVHAHGSSSMLFLQLITARIAGVKIRIAHSRNTESDYRLLHFLSKPLFNISYNCAFACGKEAGIWLFGNKRKFEIIPNGKDFNTFSYKKEIRNQLRKEYNLSNKIVIGHVGNFNYQKNHSFLIDVFYELKKISNDYYLILAGSGPEEQNIKDKVKRMGLEDSVKFLGQIPNIDISNLLNAFDIMLFPSFFEGFPNVLIEWQMNGLPCLISDTITKDVKITNLVRFKSIKEPAIEWAKEILNTKIPDRSKNIKTLEKQISKAGYNIKENAINLEKKYISLYNNAGRF